jgi:hypothetical protein
LVEAEAEGSLGRRAFIRTGSNDATSRQVQNSHATGVRWLFVVRTVCV